MCDWPPALALRLGGPLGGLGHSPAFNLVLVHLMQSGVVIRQGNKQHHIIMTL
jgi:hypothetical protein